MKAISRIVMVGFLATTLVLSTGLTSMAQVATPGATPVAVDPAMVDGFDTGQGNFARTGETDTLGPVGNPSLRWQVTLPSNAMTGIVSGAGLAFVSADTNLIAVDLRTGTTAWTLAQPEGTGSTPTLVDGVLYQSTWGEGLRAIDAASGTVLWTYLWEDADTAADPPRNASDNSPVVIDGVVYTSGGPWGGIYAVDSTTGAEIWRVPTDGEVIGNLAYADGMLVYTEQSMFDPRHQDTDPGVSGLRAVDAANGMLAWSNDAPEGWTSFVWPAVVDGIAVGGYSSTQDEHGRWIGIDVTTGAEVWTDNTVRMLFRVPSGTQGTLLLQEPFQGGVIGVDSATGDMRWELETERAFLGTAFSAGNGYLQDDEGKVIAFDPASGQTYWSFPTASAQELPFNSQIGIAPGLVLAAVGNQLFAIEGDNDAIEVQPASNPYPEAASVAPDAASYAGLTSVLNADETGDVVEGVAFGPDGTLYVIDSLNDQIDLYGPDGSYLSSFGESGTGDGQFHFNVPQGWILGDIEVAPDGTIYVLDAVNGRVEIFDSSWNLLQTITGISTGGGMGVDFDSGRVYVADLDMNVVHVFDTDGTLEADWGRQGLDSDTKFAFPTDVAVGPDGTVYVSEFGLSKVRSFSPDGTPLEILGGLGLEPGRLSGQWGLAVDNDGNVYVAGYNSGSLTVYSPGGTVIGLIDVEIHDLVGPVFVAVGGDGRIATSEESEGEVSIYTIGSPFATPVASPIP